MPDAKNSRGTSFKLDAEHSVLEYRNSAGVLSWRLPLQGIVLVAEYTTNEGPLADDYFLVFVAVDGDQLKLATASFYADGRDEIIGELARRWKTGIELTLFNSTKWASRVVWPAALAGKEYFEFREIEPSGIMERLRHLTLGPNLEYFPSRAVQEFLLAQLALKS
jgi:hypothetical protein